MRKTAVAAMACALALSACGAGNSGSAKSSEDRPLVLTTFTVLADMATEVGGEYVRVESITEAGEEIHDFQPSPSDVKHAADADMILNNGLGLERWFEKFTANSKAKKVTLSKGIEPIAIASGEYEGKPNPHAWMSPKNAQTYVDNLVEAFSDLDPDHAATFKENGAAYKAKIANVSNTMEKTLAPLSNDQRALVTCEGAFSYLAKDYNLAEYYLWPVNAEGALTPRRVADLQDSVRQRNIPAVFCESTVEGKMDSVVENTNAVYGGTLYVDSLTKADGPAPTYLDLLRYDTTTIASALTGGKNG